MRGKSRRHLANLKKVDKDKVYSMDEGLKLLKDITRDTKFTQTVNLVMNLGIEPKHADQMIRGAVSLPKGIGKTKRVIAFCDGEDAEKAKTAGAIEAGIEDLVKKISDGWMDFDVAIAHPRSMSKVGKLGRVLGPQGKMPSPKNGTVTPNVESAVREFAAGKIEFRNDAGANVHAVVGRVDFSEEDLRENIEAFVDHIRKVKPAASKGTYIKKICVSGTMSPAIQLQVAQR
ncbi:MAG: 50S ribosomal protein L1 [Phycisphaerae bacterium]|nr:50S ribosomal protein L1 [Phycisphaerae bacterium]